MFEALADFVAIHLRHENIEQNQIWRLRPGRLECHFTADGNPYAIPIAQKLRKKVKVIRPIVDDEQIGFGRLGFKQWSFKRNKSLEAYFIAVRAFFPRKD